MSQTVEALKSVVQSIKAAAGSSTATLVLLDADPVLECNASLEVLRDSGVHVRAANFPELTEQNLDFFLALKRRAMVVTAKPVAHRRGKNGAKRALKGKRVRSAWQQKMIDDANAFAERHRGQVEFFINAMGIRNVSDLTRAMNTANVPARRGGRWSDSTMYPLLKRLDIKLVP